MSNCGCNRINNDTVNYININNNPFQNNYLYGHAYTPNQKMNKTFMPEKALRNGSLFPELVSVYNPGDSISFINFVRNGGR